MKLPIGLVVTLALVAGPAAAQGTFNNGKKPRMFGTPAPAAKPYKPYVPSYGGSPAGPAAKPRNPGVAEAPEAPVFKPYQPYKPYKPGSLFGPDGRPRR